MSHLNFQTTHRDGLARVGHFTTPHGKVTTPCFMPVGTRGAVRTLTSQDLEELGPADSGSQSDSNSEPNLNTGAEVILGNTYHLMLRPGDELIARHGGLHEFMDWNGSILTDSGGYQVLSLEPKITDEGAVFKSTYDGARVELTPELAVRIQTNLGSDIQMVLDVCPPLPSEPDVISEAVRITHLWAKRAREAFHLETSDMAKECKPAQFGIVQGGLDLNLRQKSAEELTAIGFEGYAVGGLSVGEKRPERNSILKETIAALPESSPRYLMGVGDPLSLIEAITFGADMFDCVLPTRLARHGTALTSSGRLNIKSAKFIEDVQPLDPEFESSPANRWSRSYLRHLFAVGEPVAGRILTLHNLAWTFDLINRTRDAIANNSLDELLGEIERIWERPSEG